MRDGKVYKNNFSTANKKNSRLHDNVITTGILIFEKYSEDSYSAWCSPRCYVVHAFHLN